MKQIKAAELVLDFTIYPRNNVDAKNVSMIVDALASGAELPPVIIDKKSRRVIDGFHRTKGHLKFYGDDAMINVVEKSYKSEGEMFLDSMRYNAAHGARLDPCDRTHCVIVAEKLGLSLDAVAGALHMPVDRLGSLKNDRTATYNRLSVPLKQTIKHMAGKPLTQRQNEANDKLSGMNQSFYANQLIELIESEMVDLSNERTMDSLKRLHELLERLLVPVS